MTVEHPVTLGDLRLVTEPPSCVCGGIHHSRPATVADLVSALRAEGVLVVEKVESIDGHWPAWVTETAGDINQGYIAATSGRFMIPVEAVLDALAEAQPFPPAGGW